MSTLQEIEILDRDIQLEVACRAPFPVKIVHDVILHVAPKYVKSLQKLHDEVSREMILEASRKLAKSQSYND